MLNAANAAKLFYPQYMPADHQTIPQLAPVTKGVIAYEGIIKKSSYKKYESLKAPVAQGDGPQWVENKNPEVTQFSVYGSAHSGIFGSIIRRTNVAAILQLNLLATDFFHEKAYPTYLYYNPYSSSKKIVIKIEKNKKADLYNTVTGKFIARNVSTSTQINIPAESSAIIVQVPSNGTISCEGTKMKVNGIAVDYHAVRTK